MVGKVLTKAEIDKLSREYLHEFPEQREKDIQAIRQWILSQPHLGDKARSDDKFILNFLRGCKFSYEKTKHKIDTWHTVRTHCPELFEGWDLDDPKVISLIEQGTTVPLKGYDKHGRKVMVLRSSYVDHSKYTIEDTIKCSLMTNEVMMEHAEDPQAAVKGVVIINDVGGADANIVKQMSPAFAKKVMVIFQDTYPAHPKENHMLNLPPIMERICQLMMSFANQKMRDRTRFYPKGSSFKKLHDALGKDVLPEEYGGKAGPMQLQIDEFKKLIFDNKAWIQKQDGLFKSQESKRVGQQKTFSDVFGMEGSFRQLEFD